MENDSTCDAYQEIMKDLSITGSEATQADAKDEWRHLSEKNDFHTRKQEKKHVGTEPSLLKQEVSKEINNSKCPLEFFPNGNSCRVHEKEKINKIKFEQNMGGDSKMIISDTNFSDNIMMKSGLEFKYGNDPISDLLLQVTDILDTSSGVMSGEGKTSETFSKGCYSHILGCKDAIQEKFILQNINEDADNKMNMSEGNKTFINNSLIEKEENHKTSNLKRHLLFNILKVDEGEGKSIEDGVTENLGIQRQNDSQQIFERMPNFKCIDLLRKVEKIQKKSECSTLGGRNNLTRTKMDKKIITRALLKVKGSKREGGNEKVELSTMRNMDYILCNPENQHTLLAQNDDDSVTMSFSEAVLVNKTKKACLEDGRKGSLSFCIGMGNFNDSVVRMVLFKIKSKANKKINKKEKEPVKRSIIKPPWSIIFPPHKYRHYYPFRTIWWLSLALVEYAINVQQSS